ncbi:hypothetical protein D3C78_1966530 [compost metagenome]
MFQEQLRIAVFGRWLVPQVRQEAVEVVVQKEQGGGKPGGVRAALRGRAQGRAIAVAAGAADQD